MKNLAYNIYYAVFLQGTEKKPLLEPGVRSAQIFAVVHQVGWKRGTASARARVLEGAIAIFSVLSPIALSVCRFIVAPFIK